MKIISMSLYGTDPKYVSGAVANCQLAPEIYPGWELRIYTEKDHPAIPELSEAGAHRIFTMPKAEGHAGMMWRFFAASEPEAEYVIFRDADSRLNVREKAAVDAWIESGKALHVMRDHPDHAQWPMLGGLWGIKGGLCTDMRGLVNEWAKISDTWGQKLDDMRMLAGSVWEQLGGDCLQHCSVESPYGGDPFPEHEPVEGHCGQIVG